MSTCSSVLLCSSRREGVDHIIKDYLIPYLFEAVDNPAENGDSSSNSSFDILDHCMPTIAPVVMTSLDRFKSIAFDFLSKEKLLNSYLS